MITTILWGIVLICTIGLPLFFMINSIKKVVLRDYIFDIKFVKLHNNKLEFKNDFQNHNLPIVKLKFGDTKYNFLIDTGADVNLVNKSLFDILNVNNDITSKERGLVITASGEEKSTEAILDFKYGNTKFQERMVIMDLDSAFAAILEDNKIQLHGVLGSTFFNKHKWAIDFDNMIVWTK